MVEVSPARDRVKINKRPVPVNDTHPLWTKHPNECSKEDYIECLHHRKEVCLGESG